MDPRILLFTACVAVATGMVFGSLPALQAARANVGAALKESAAAVTTGRRGRQVRGGLVITEIALALILMTGAGLLFRTFVRILQVDPGFDAQQLIVLPLDLDAGFDGAQRVQFTQQLLEGIRGLPGVTDAMAGPTIPFRFTGNSRCCWSTAVQGDPAFASADHQDRFMIHPITADYFATLHAKLLAGRDFTKADGTSGPPLAILNASAARALFGAADVVGRPITLAKQQLTVIGVENDLHHWGLTQPPGNNVYVPYARFAGDFPMLSVAVRASMPVAALAPALRSVVWRLKPDLPIGSIQTMEQRVSGSLASQRFLALLFGVFACVSLLLACAGIYSSMLYAVGQRSREMGVRLALGASAREIVGMILRSGLLIAIAGIGIGLGVAAAVSRIMTSMLWNVPPTDPLTYAAAGIILGATALLACLGPALRAARTDPLRTMRAD